MLIKDLFISNPFSYKKSKISFGKHNIITGVNGSGKSNLIRLLRSIIASPSNAFFTSFIENHQKFDQDKCSWIKIRIKFSDKENRLISKLLFRNPKRKFEEAEFVLLWAKFLLSMYQNKDCRL